MKILALLMFFFLCKNLFTQSADSTRSIVLKPKREKIKPISNPWEMDDAFVWLDAGLGTTTFPNDALSAYIGLNIQKREQMFSIRLLRSEEFVIFSDYDVTEKNTELSFLYGVAGNSRWGHASILGGFSYIKGVQRGRFLYTESGDEESWFSWDIDHYEKERHSNFGFPLEAQLIFTPIPFIGIGIKGIANINSTKTYGGFFLTAQIGKITSW